MRASPITGARRRNVSRAGGNSSHRGRTRHGETWLGNGLLIRFDEEALGKSLSQILAELQEGRPSIILGDSANALHVSVPTLTDEDLDVVSGRLRAVLGAS